MLESTGTALADAFSLFDIYLSFDHILPPSWEVVHTNICGAGIDSPCLYPTFPLA